MFKNDTCESLFNCIVLSIWLFIIMYFVLYYFNIKINNINIITIGGTDNNDSNNILLLVPVLANFI